MTIGICFEPCIGGAFSDGPPIGIMFGGILPPAIGIGIPGLIGICPGTIPGCNPGPGGPLMKP